MTASMYYVSVSTDGSGVINFMEFVCTLWNLLTLPERHCAVIAYMIKDHSTKGDISCKCNVFLCTACNPKTLTYVDLCTFSHRRLGCAGAVRVDV